MMPTSKRPQRYDKCFLKESDVLMEKRDDSTKDMPITPRIPVRLVMNDRTVSAYIDDTLTNKYITFILSETTIVKLTDEPKCFKFKTNVKETMFCQLEATNGDWVEEWDYDFNLFKSQCKRKRSKSDVIFPDEQKQLETKFENQVQQLKLDMVQEKEQVINRKTEETEELKLVKKVENAQKNFNERNSKGI